MYTNRYQVSPKSLLCVCFFIILMYLLKILLCHIVKNTQFNLRLT